MGNKDWGKVGALLTWIGILIATVLAIWAFTSFNEAEKFFGITLVLMLGMFVYLVVFFEFQSPNKTPQTLLLSRGLTRF